MKYRLYLLDFYNGVHFGKGNLDSTELTFHADTFFSALFQEALKLGKEEEFLSESENGRIVFSDAFPYMGQTYYIPKPMVQADVKDENSKGDSTEKKLFKNMKYIPLEHIEKFMAGDFPKEHLEDMKKLGKYSMKVSAGIRGNEEPEPYRVNAFYFGDGNGLYIIAGYQNENVLNLFEELLKSLSYRGMGGKKSSGLGRFEYCGKAVPKEIEDKIAVKGSRNILLSTALPEDSELLDVLNDASYSLIKRSGFVDSETYAAQQMRKKDLYVFAPGSCFRNPFGGRIIKERNGGTHPVFRYERAFFLGVNI